MFSTRWFTLLWVMLVSLQACRSMHCATYEKKLVVVITSYNNKKWYRLNLLSIFSQEYRNYTVIYIDDASQDGTAHAVENLIYSLGMQHKVVLIKNTERKGALENTYNAIQRCDERDIILMVDGDDALIGSGVFAYINRLYTDDDQLWLTYGQYSEHPSGKLGICRPLPAWIFEQQQLRNIRYVTSHLRTFYAGLFKRIQKEDLCDDEGTFFTVTGDMAAMFPMIEMAQDHHMFVSKVLYRYNTANTLNDFKVALAKQHAVERIIRSRKPYEKLSSLW